MNDLKIASAQFEHKSGDKNYNLSIIEKLSADAAAKGVEVIAFHECSITGYSFARHLDRDELFDITEPIPQGPSTKKLIEIAKKYKISILAGLFERDRDNKIFKAQVCVNESGLIAKFRKIHPFINPNILPGAEYCIFDLHGWKCGMLICYDNNIIENVRATALLGAQIIFMPHVTMCTPSPMPGRGFVDPILWQNRDRDPVALRQEFDGPKGREWIMKWLPARAYDNGIYAVFSNAVGMDDDQLKNGNSLILDPYGEIIAECKTLGDDYTIGVCTPEKLTLAGGCRYRNARKPELYGEIISQAHQSVQKVVWMDNGNE